MSPNWSLSSIDTSVGTDTSPALYTSVGADTGPAQETSVGADIRQDVLRPQISEKTFEIYLQ